MQKVIPGNYIGRGHILFDISLQVSRKRTQIFDLTNKHF